MYFLKSHEEFRKFSTEHVRKSKNWVFSWILLSKVENVWTWNLQGSYVSWEWRMTQNLKKNWLVNSKLTWVIGWILSRALKNFENLHFNELFWPYYIMFELKKYRGVIFDCTEGWCKIQRKTDLYFLKWHEEFCKLLFTSWKIDFILESKMAELNRNK